MSRGFLLGFGLPACAILCVALSPDQAQPMPVHVVAAENMYGDIAAQLGGPGVVVTSILSSPDQDPHLFEASPATARAVAGADIVIANGLGYDPWLQKLLLGKPGGRDLLVVADIASRTAGDNPHLWYDVGAMLAFAPVFSAALDRRDAARADDHAQRLAAFTASVHQLQNRIAAMRVRMAGLPVTATEPVFGLMAADLGMAMRNMRFQMAVMNDTEPRASDIAAFETDLRSRRVRVLFTNSQAEDAAARRLRGIAVAAHVPVVAVTETEPAGTTYQAWMASELDALDQALGK